MNPTSVTVRMYDVSFGDCFLVRFRSDDGEKRVLIDCGTHSAGKRRRPFADVVEAVQADLAAFDEPNLHALVVSHRHRDHVWGFERPGWDQVSAAEVWLPWTENPRDPVARKLLERMSKSGLALAELDAVESSPLRQLLNNSLKNDDAIRTVTKGLRGSPKPRYLGLPLDEHSGVAAVPTTSLDFPVHLLGPWRDEAIIRDVEPPEGVGYFGAGGRQLRVVADGPAPPFQRWRTPLDDYRANHPDLFRLIGNVGAFINAARESAYDLAAAIEDSVNGSSLVLMFEFGSAYLLFPGDAQWGTWTRALNNPAARQLLERTTFLKVGHHGSHNATPKEFVEQVLDRPRAAMVSVAATDIESWRDIPKRRLLNRLADRCDLVVRSDRPDPAEGLRFGPDELWCEIELPA